jgi:hypothetical protein
LDKELLKRAKAIHDRLVRDRPEARTPPIETTAEPAPVVEQLKNEPRYVFQTAAPVGVDPEPEPVVAEVEVVPEPPQRRCKLDRILDRVDAPRDMKPSGLDCWDNEDERNRRLGKWAWMVW